MATSVTLNGSHIDLPLGALAGDSQSVGSHNVMERMAKINNWAERRSSGEGCA